MHAPVAPGAAPDRIDAWEREPLTSAEVGAEFHRHPETVRDAIRAGDLHGIQRIKRGRWLVERRCAAAWARGAKCPHQTDTAARAKPNVVPITAARGGTR